MERKTDFSGVGEGVTSCALSDTFNLKVTNHVGVTNGVGRTSDLIQVTNIRLRVTKCVTTSTPSAQNPDLVQF